MEGCRSRWRRHRRSAAALQQAGHLPEAIDTQAEVSFKKQKDGFAITSINLATRARVGGIPDSAFQRGPPMRSTTARCPKAPPPSARSSSMRDWLTREKAR